MNKTRTTKTLEYYMRTIKRVIMFVIIFFILFLIVAGIIYALPKIVNFVLNG